MHKILYIIVIISTFSLVFNNGLYAQEIPDSLRSDTLLPPVSITDSIDSDTLNRSPDLDRFMAATDSLNSLKDTTRTPITSGIEFDVVYNASDSVIFGMDNRKVFMYKGAKVTYGTLELTADYIEFDMNTNEVFATGLPDSTGKMAGRPFFKDAQQQMEAERLRYNFKSQKGYIEAVKTEQEGGWLHANQTKKDEKGHIHIKDGKYTTCDADNPHFYIALTKAKSIPGDKIVTGPAYLVIEEVPFPIGLPFGFFPNTKTNTSGILVPQYGEEANRGFFLRNGGYYLAINEYMDLTVTGDIYTNGTWGMRVGTNYKKRYKFSGGFNGRIYQNISGEKGLNYSKSNDYSVQWNHAQDGKANPNQRFSASVNLSSRKFDEQHSRVLTNALTSTKSSSISYQRSWANLPINFSASANHSQNSQTKYVNLNLPKMSFNMSRIYPFRFKNSTGKGGFWEDIQLSYSSTLDNRIATYDSLLFTSRAFENTQNGFSHTIPLTWNYKPKKIRNFTFSPNLSYKGVAYTHRINKSWQEYYHADEDSTYYDLVVDTIKGLTYAHAYYPSLSASLSPKIYGMFVFRETSKIEAIRHVMSPSVSFSYIPDVSPIVPDYYRELIDQNGDTIQTYSIYEGSIYGTPSLGRSSKTMNFALRNNIEAKIRQEGDTAVQSKKVKLLDNFNFSTNMNFADSVKFRPISFNGNTRFFQNKMNVTFRGSMDPYAQDSLYRRINVSEFNRSGKLVRLTSAGMSVGLNLKGGSRKTGGKEEEEEIDPIESTPLGTPQRDPEYDAYDEDYYYGEYVDFNVPWSLRIDYSLNYSTSRNQSSIIQTIRFSGDFSLTPKWKIGYNTGYDFKNSKVTTSNLSIYRDLHCWEMRLTAVPFGKYKSFNFQINAKSAILQDLKYNKRVPWQDNF